MKELIEVFRMNEVSVETRIQIIEKLGDLINYDYAVNVTEPLCYELIKQLDPKSEILKRYEDFLEREKKWKEQKSTEQQ